MFRRQLLPAARKLRADKRPRGSRARECALSMRSPDATAVAAGLQVALESARALKGIVAAGLEWCGGGDLMCRA